MIFYNSLTELVAGQFLIIALFEAIVIAVSIFVFKKKLTVKTFLFPIIIASVISMLSVIVARGSYSGMTYYERFGWPFQYYYISRNIEIGTNVSVPYAFRFDFLKFIANTFFWGFIPVIAILLYREKDKKYKIFAICSLMFFIILTSGCWYFNVVNEVRERIPGEAALKEKELPPTTALLPPDKNIISIKRHIVESTYPDFKDFENQKDHLVEIVSDGNEYYFAYITQGYLFTDRKDLFIVEATCFRADSNRAYKTGEFPDLADSFMGYKDIEPKTCRGIKKDSETVGEGIDFVTLSQDSGMTNAVKDPPDFHIRVIKQTAEWQSFWNQVVAGTNYMHTVAPSVDFNSEIVVAVLAGQKGSLGYTIEIKQIRLLKTGGLLVDTIETQPGSDCNVAEAESRPYHLVKINKDYFQKVVPNLSIVRDTTCE